MAGERDLHLPAGDGLTPLCGGPGDDIAITYALVTCTRCMAKPTRRAANLDRVWETLVMVGVGVR